MGISADGTTLAVGAYGEGSDAIGIDGDQTNDNARNSGAVYLFTNSGGTWGQQAYIKASNTGYLDHFGVSVGLSGDGSTLAVGGWYESSNATDIGGDQADNSTT